MLGVVVFLFSAFAFLIWNSYRVGGRRIAEASRAGDSRPE